MATLYKTPFPYTSGLSYQNDSTVGRRQSDTLSNHRKQLQQDTISQPTAYQTLLWNKCGCAEYKDRVMGYIWTSHNHRPPQAIPCTYSMGKDVGTKPSSALRACSWDPYLQDRCRRKPHSQSRHRMKSLRNHSPHRSNTGSNNHYRGSQLVKASPPPGYWRTLHGHNSAT